jgi:hypothetical protein
LNHWNLDRFSCEPDSVLRTLTLPNKSIDAAFLAEFSELTSCGFSIVPLESCNRETFFEGFRMIQYNVSREEPREEKEIAWTLDSLDQAQDVKSFRSSRKDKNLERRTEALEALDERKIDDKEMTFTPEVKENRPSPVVSEASQATPPSKPQFSLQAPESQEVNSSVSDFMTEQKESIQLTTLRSLAEDPLSSSFDRFQDVVISQTFLGGWSSGVAFLSQLKDHIQVKEYLSIKQGQPTVDELINFLEDSTFLSTYCALWLLHHVFKERSDEWGLLAKKAFRFLWKLTKSNSLLSTFESQLQTVISSHEKPTK